MESKKETRIKTRIKTRTKMRNEICENLWFSIAKHTGASLSLDEYGGGTFTIEDSIGELIDDIVDHEEHLKGRDLVNERYKYVGGGADWLNDAWRVLGDEISGTIILETDDHGVYVVLTHAYTDDDNSLIHVEGNSILEKRVIIEHVQGSIWDCIEYFEHQ